MKIEEPSFIRTLNAIVGPLETTYLVEVVVTTSFNLNSLFQLP